MPLHQEAWMLQKYVLSCLVCKLHGRFELAYSIAFCLPLNMFFVTVTKATAVNSLWCNCLINSHWNKSKMSPPLLPQQPSPLLQKCFLTGCRRASSQVFLIQLNILIGNVINYVHGTVSRIFNRRNMSSYSNKMRTLDKFLSL